MVRKKMTNFYSPLGNFCFCQDYMNLGTNGKYLALLGFFISLNIYSFDLCFMVYYHDLEKITYTKIIKSRILNFPKQ